ncbi:MAG TPA: TetR/AcrR family transcriptional regulator [Acidimicrobiales bacterium]|nr:TetR/AcrR family transcriptional regulator [Acidimicrobiales bacterium]
MTATEVEDAVEVVGMVGTGAKPMRADAIRNRQRILEAAEAIFATEGLSVPIDTVAERAGVGVGTLYRHFPTKEALFEAIVEARLEYLLESARSRATASDPREALFSFLGEFAQQASAKHDLFDALSSAGIDIKSSCAGTVDDMKRNIDVLLQRAVANKSVRSDISTDEMIGLVVGVCQGGGHAGYDDATVQRMVKIVCDGLRPPLPG